MVLVETTTMIKLNLFYIIVFIALQVIIVISTNVSNDSSTDTLYQRKSIPNSKQKIRITKSCILYYSNSTATFNLILSGDFKENPGSWFLLMVSANQNVTSAKKLRDLTKNISYVNVARITSIKLV